MHILKEDLSKKEDFKGYKVILYILIILFGLVLISSTLDKNLLNTSIAIAGIVLAFVLNWVSNKFNTFFMDIFLSIANIFLFISMYLGSIKGFYGLFPWWDVLAHVLSGVIFSLLGFILLFRLHKGLDLSDKGQLFLAVLFSMSFGIAAGVFWEIYEFSMNIFFGLNMQSGGLLDTMKDLISDTIGAAFTSIAVGIYIKRQLSQRNTKKTQSKSFRD